MLGKRDHLFLHIQFSLLMWQRIFIIPELSWRHTPTIFLSDMSCGLSMRGSTKGIQFGMEFLSFLLFLPFGGYKGSNKSYVGLLLMGESWCL